MFLPVKMLNNFPIFTHAQITKFQGFWWRQGISALSRPNGSFFKQKFGIFPFSVSVNNKSRFWSILRQTFCTDNVRVFIHHPSSQRMTAFLKESSWIHQSIQLVSTHLHFMFNSQTVNAGNLVLTTGLKT